jgi:acyl-CoA thioesterase-2
VPSGGAGKERAGDDVTEFEGRNQQLDYHRVFGGQLLGQFLRIASATCPAKTVKSQHVVSTREGRADEPIRYQATCQTEGRSFAAGRAEEWWPPPRYACTQRRTVPSITRTAGTSSTDWPRAPRFEVWMRTPAVAQELAPALRPIDGVGQRGNGTAFTSAVTSHTIWFHRAFRTDGWLLLRQHRRRHAGRLLRPSSPLAVRELRFSMQAKPLSPSPAGGRADY